MAKAILASELTAAMERLFAELGKGPGQSYMEEVGESLSTQLDTQFNASETPQGDGWSPWRFRKVDSSDSHKTLWDSGRLRDSLVAQTADSIRFYTSRDLKYGTGVEYAGIHDEGATITTAVALVGRGGVGWIPEGTTLTIPQRRFSGWSEATLEDAADIIGEGIIVNVFGG